MMTNPFRNINNEIIMNNKIRNKIRKHIISNVYYQNFRHAQRGTSHERVNLIV